MSKKTGDYQIPFHKNGNQLEYNEYWNPSLEWRDNFEFHDTLALSNYGRGRSSVTFIMERSNGCFVSVFVSDFFDMASHKDFKAGQITGEFTFTKKGQNYGCKLAHKT